ncbi:MAG: thioredoxin family protein [Spirochaetaceae bacterium]
MRLQSVRPDSPDSPAVSIRFALLLVLVAVSLLSPAVVAAQSGEGDGTGPGSYFSSFEAGRLEAQRRGRPLLLLITAPGWCEPCDRFEASVLTDTGVEDLLRESFVVVRITDRDPEHARFDFPGYPSVLVFHPAGGRIAAIRAPASPRAFREALSPYRRPADELLALAESTASARLRYAGGAFVHREGDRWVHEGDGEGDDSGGAAAGSGERFRRYREDERYLYLRSENDAEEGDAAATGADEGDAASADEVFLALPTDGGQAFRWNEERERWEGAFEITEVTGITPR